MALVVEDDKGIQALTVRKNTPASTSGTDGDYQPQITDTLGATWVHPVQSAVQVSVTSAGLTTATTAYTTGDQVGTGLTFAGMANVSTWGGIIVGATILDKGKIINTGDFELFLFSAAVTAAADNAAADFSDADMANYVGSIKFLTADWKTFAPASMINRQNHAAPPYSSTITAVRWSTCAETTLCSRRKISARSSFVVRPYVINARLAAAMARRASSSSASVTRAITVRFVGLTISITSRPCDSTNAPSM